MGRPANADGRQTRAAVMNAALDLFSQKGYFGTSLRDIATVVGVRESALYNYFASKEQLFEALITAASEERIEQFHEITERPVEDVGRLLEAIVLKTLESFRQPRQEQLFRILMADGIRLTRDGRLNLMERLSAGQVLMRQLFVRLIREGHLRAADPDVLLLAFTGPMFVWRQLNAIGADHPVLRAPAGFAKAHVDQFLQGAVAGRAAAAHRPAKPRRTRDRSAPAPFDFAQGVVSVVEPTERRARERVGESEGRSPSVSTVATRGATRRARAVSADSASKSER